jgi:hypothetical protein
MLTAQTTTRRWKNFFWISAGILALAALVGSITPHAIAQIRAALVREMDSPIRGVRQIENISPNFSSGSFSVTETITPSIPAGKKLFLQSISVHTFLTDLQSPMETRLTIRPGTIAQVYVLQTFQGAGDSGQRHFTGNAPINILVNPGETFDLFVFRTDNLGSSSLNFVRASIHGYLVDANP